MFMLGYCEFNFQRELNCYIFIVVVFGGMCIGVLMVVVDFMGVIGLGIGIFLVVIIIYQYFEMFDKECVSELGFFGFQFLRILLS